MTIATEIIPPRAPPLAVEKPYSLSRFLGSLFMGIWVAIFLYMAVDLYEGFDQEKLLKYGPKMLSGLAVTLELVITAIVLGALLSFPLAFARMSKSRMLSSAAYGYVYFFRGTPLIAQLYLIYYGFGSFRPFFESINMSAKPITAPCSRSRSTPPRTRLKSCVVRSRACRAASTRPAMRLGCTRRAPSGMSSCHRPSSSHCGRMAMRSS
jgi:His/Glu/Gln/Arg/opine family amino acid ABC transporter permease subunit